jgi:hypothetical protein
VTQFAIINLSPNAPRETPDLEQAMRKTFTDCYLAEGFTGGAWAYASNTNDAEGVHEKSTLNETERRLANYVLGWDNLEKHHAYAKTDLFAEEIDKLMPYFAEGTGAFYVEFEEQ